LKSGAHAFQEGKIPFVSLDKKTKSENCGSNFDVEELLDPAYYTRSLFIITTVLFAN